MLDMGLTTQEAVAEVRPEAEASGEGVVDTLVKTGRLEASLVVMAKSTSSASRRSTWPRRGSPTR
ncbi:MAG: hypothetical protein ACKPGK_16965 [Verrucomicrobiota bacterium]